ncbi:MAG: uroporphyrinogen decarboxylase family protein [Phycisphaeraceae bacterium]
MTERERFIAALTFQQPWPLPFMPGHGRESTRAVWREQGMPADVQDPASFALRQLGGAPPPAPADPVSPGVDFCMRPQYDEKVLEHRPAPPNSGQPGVLVVQDWKGNVCEIADTYDVSYLRSARDFVTRTWLRCPVEQRSDWEKMAWRYDADDPARFPDDWLDRCRRLRGRAHPVGVTISGPFWQLREWLGFEGLCMLLIDDPDFARQMISFWQDFVARMLERMLRDFVPDYVTISEDMAYKQNPMIGPEMARAFLLPCWRRWVEICRAAGVPLLHLDSDGYIGSLLPLWIEAGFNWTSPVEVAAGNDLPAFRKTFGKAMAYSGGVDKRAMARGGETIHREMDRLRPVIEAGGYVPGCDHAVPADVSWPNFLEYCRLLAEATGHLPVAAQDTAVQ